MSRKASSPPYLVLFLLPLWLPIAAHAVSISERGALIDFYNATGGPGWTNSAGWNGPSGTECSWYGVTCVDDAVYQLALPQNNLSGQIPGSIGQLTALTDLALNNNQIAGSLPPEIGNLSELRALVLRFNQISGTIPPEIANLSQLLLLHLGFNQFSGTIPAALSTLGNLQSLDLAFNQLSGSIPAEIGNLASLQVLDVTSNQLTGGIPAELGNLAGLQTLSLILNQLSGPIPPELGNLSQLQALRIDFNPISGTIPPSLGNLTQLQDLILSRTDLSGPIPPELGNLTQLIRLDLAANRLSGNIPPEIGNLSNLSVLALASNQLAGEVPGALENLTNLRDGDGVNLGFNALHSSDPVLLAFLDTKQGFGGWQATQTVAPADLGVGAPAATSLTLSWTPLNVFWTTGRYRVFSSTSPGGPFSLAGETASLYDASLTVTGLAPGTTYFFVVRSLTDPSPQNASFLTSDPSLEVSGTTLPANTPPGTGVIVQPIDTSTGTAPVILNFDNVVQTGSTTLTTGASGPPPPVGFQLGTPPLYYEISTSATFLGQVTVCIDYSGSSFGDESQLRLLHFESSAWVDTTISLDTSSHVICGRVLSFSPFVVARRAETTVRIDIKPGSFPNSINLGSNGNVPVAILSGAGFDARRVDPRTVTLAGAPVELTPHGDPKVSIEDVDHDGRLDLLLHVETRALRLAPGDTQAALLGTTYEGVRIRGVDSVRIVH